MNHQLPLRGRIATALLALALSGTLQAASPAPDTLKVGDYQVQVATFGAGNYTVILESGFGRDLGVWRNVAPALAKSARVMAYSRAGHGKSDPRLDPPTIAARTNELEQLIATAGLKPPFVLVGHSYGGFLVRSFATRHPEQVAGMVFVDPSDEAFNVELRKLDAAGVDKDTKLTEQFMPPKLHAELRSVQAVLDSGKLPFAGALPDVPVAVLTSVQKREQPQLFLETPAAVQVWRGLHERFFRSFSNGSHIVTAESGHNIHQEQPQLVVSAVEGVIAAAESARVKRVREAARAELMRRLEQGGSDAEMAKALETSGFGELDANRLGYELLGPRKQPLLAARLMKANAGKYSLSDNVQDSYGEVLLATGHPAKAKAQFMKAIALAEALGKGDKVVAGYRANLAKADQALGAH
ncbi:alpha/beta fold hydrolase [Telluria aromaticivorans]|uniref:Alpha/beta hydrolase n=1 Tax=Telluria aromaticivorans TaxID=2725995 RepID=A0A7Y2JZS5_9BURK|nr:alpha/beta hydrolase [Telluria aromaticivorans]NNG24030.1 alpha/beta hydrolase [Telluria aromaticivorans]